MLGLIKYTPHSKDGIQMSVSCVENITLHVYKQKWQLSAGPNGQQFVIEGSLVACVSWI